MADFGAVCPEADVVRRHLIFLRPHICVLYDEIETCPDQEVWLNFTCHGALSQTAGGYMSTAGRNRLFVATGATDATDSHTTGWSTHRPQIPAHRLVSATGTVQGKASLLTVLVAGPLGEELPDVRLSCEAGR